MRTVLELLAAPIFGAVVAWFYCEHERKRWHERGVQEGMDAVMDAVMDVGGAPLAWEIVNVGLKQQTEERKELN